MALEIVAPEDVVYTCTRCGECCREWNVMLGPGEEDTLRALDWAGLEDDLVDQKPAVSTPLPEGGTARRLRRHDDGACVYLGSDGLCRIHRHFGAEAKPLMCRMYPFGFYPMGDRVGVDCSFSCRSVSSGQGAPVSQSMPEWAARLEEPPSQAAHRLTPDRKIPGALMWELEHALVGFLSHPELSLLDAIRCCLRFVELATSGDPTVPSANKLRAAIVKGLPGQVGDWPRGGHMDRTQRAVFYQWLFVALNPFPPNADLLQGGARGDFERRRVAAAQAFARRQGNPVIAGRERDIDFKTIDAVDAAPVLEEGDDLLRTYLRAKIVGQRFLNAGHQELAFVDAVPRFFLVVPQLLWASAALAAERGAERAALDDLRGALRILDATLGRLDLDELPRKSARAWRFVVEETDFVLAACNELLKLEPDEGPTLPGFM